MGEIRRLEKWHSDNLPPGGYTKEQVEAGYDKLAGNFGFYHSLVFMEEVTPFTRKELLEWPLQEFKHNLRYIAWKNYTDKKYADIMKKKK